MIEIMHEQLYLKEPRTERLRKGSTGRLRHLISTGWRETERRYTADYVTLRLERPGNSREDVPKASPARPVRHSSHRRQTSRSIASR
jgi:hypothetical protein